MNWKEVRGRLSSFDALAFKCSGIITTPSIAMVQQYMNGDSDSAQYVHVAIVVKPDTFPLYHPARRVFGATRIGLFEANKSGGLLLDRGLPLYPRRYPFLGVQLRDAEVAVPTQLCLGNEQVCWLRLTEGAHRRINISAWPDVFERYIGASCDLNPCSLGASANMPGCRWCWSLSWFRSCTETCVNTTLRPCAACACTDTGEDDELYLNEKRPVTCSELVASVYKELGVLPAGLDAHNVMPADFFPRDHSTTYDDDCAVPVIFEQAVKIT